MRTIVNVATGKTTIDRDWTAPEPTAEQVADQLAQYRAAASMSRRAFAILAMKEKWITPAEAKAWAPGNALPEVVTTSIFANYKTDEDRVEAEINASTQTVIHRNDELLIMLMAVKEVTPEQMDAHFSIPINTGNQNRTQ